MIRFLYRFLMRKRISAAEHIVAEMACCPSQQDKERFQVEKFNRTWKEARDNVPFYRRWQQVYALPDEIRSLDDLSAWPILTKSDLRNLEDFKRADVPYPTGHILTGGSTGEPVRLPSWGDAAAGISQMVGRKAYGIEPGDRTFLLWGHEHLYGTGIKRKINAYRRRFKDWLAGWTRVSAYDLGEPAMKSAFERFRRCRPKFVIGFSPAVLAFCRINKARAGEVKSVKVILCTAGPLSPDEKLEIETFFGGKVCMEYGSVECAIMAYTRPSDGQYAVFWNTHLLQAVKDGEEYKNIVTRLTRHYVPLIRYDIGDYLELDPQDEVQNTRSVLEVKTVKGRPSEMLRFKCGVSFFGALVGDCIKQVSKVVQSQTVVDEDQNDFRLLLVTTEPLMEKDRQLIRNRLSLTVKDIDKLNITIEQVGKLQVTAGGKTPRVIRGY